MALFFDQSWFDEKMSVAGLTKLDVAAALGLSELELAEMWKDQREISDVELNTLALLLNEPVAEVKKRGGLQGTPRADSQGAIAPTPSANDVTNARLERIENLLEEILRELKAKS